MNLLQGGRRHFEVLPRFLSITPQFLRQNCLSRAFVWCWSFWKFLIVLSWEMLDWFGDSGLTTNFRRNDRIEFRRLQWTLFLLPDMFVHVSQELFICLPGCIELPAKRTQLCCDCSLGLQLPLKTSKSLRVVGHSEPNFHSMLWLLSNSTKMS